MYTIGIQYKSCAAHGACPANEFEVDSAGDTVHKRGPVHYADTGELWPRGTSHEPVWLASDYGNNQDSNSEMPPDNL